MRVEDSQAASAGVAERCLGGKRDGAGAFWLTAGARCESRMRSQESETIPKSDIEEGRRSPENPVLFLFGTRFGAWSAQR
jgi:hypothetical protein